MTGNPIEFAILKKAIRGVEGFTADFMDCGEMFAVSFERKEVRLSFFLSKNGRNLVTYKIFYCEAPKTPEMEVLGIEVLDLIFEEAVKTADGEIIL